MTESESHKEHDWHPLPDLIGGLIVSEDKKDRSTGGYRVRQREDGYIEIIRDAEQVGAIQPPKDGWSSELESVSANVWEGYR